MEQSKTAPVPDNEVEEVEKLHKQLITALGRPPDDKHLRDHPYWDTSSTTFQDNFKARVTELLKTYADRACSPAGSGRQAAARKTSG